MQGFMWGWNDYPPYADPSMNRKRAAVLLRAWRNTSRKSTSHGMPLRKLERLGVGVYRVSQYGETATMIVPRKSA